MENAEGSESVAHISGLLRYLRDVGGVLQQMSPAVRERIFGNQPAAVIDEVIANPLLQGRIIDAGMLEGLPGPGFTEHEPAFHDVIDSHRRDRVTVMLRLLLKLSRLKGVIGKEDVRALLKDNSEERLSYAWSRNNIRQILSTPNTAACLDPDNDEDNMREAFITAAIRSAHGAWWHEWVKPENAPSALVAAASELLAEDEQMKLTV
jgi:hypothetical protein